MEGEEGEGRGGEGWREERRERVGREEKGGEDGERIVFQGHYYQICCIPTSLVAGLAGQQWGLSQHSTARHTKGALIWCKY